jgi:hypothetical protein
VEGLAGLGKEGQSNEYNGMDTAWLWYRLAVARTVGGIQEVKPTLRQNVKSWALVAGVILAMLSLIMLSIWWTI